MSKHPIPDWLRSQFSRIEDEVQELGPCGVFTQMRTVTQTYFEQQAEAAQPPVLGGDYDYRTDLACYFGLSYASWLTLPRVLMEAMPDDWQGRMAALLHEYDDAMINPPNLGTTVRVTVDGKMVPTPTWLVNYRHPDRQMIAQVFGRANPPKPAGSELA
ncbi:hypothetical protein A264_21789 [Pseudomonas syringae pv. actinidiae ICMP 19071]|uniref:hypothetical protein n=1 Tax=Pseudomonas syringae TaxID=317 RepID=UPI00035824C3|nr:hypothetical protein [Pseudomonas syringae]EPM55908.1 hypothetical protein A264_21789 [Pseudomonas syringae pv. actinidiae ICMP 19071]EPM61598.1 hypothetical protein A262_05954 [Pseudomonas syringae pv. actinidiae ICMP 19073]EPM75552.1 hypothetical protein A3SO_21390 [Pseudomonas syringae pv. actinidiae ICMP 19072]OSN66623.1 hypothetical protein BV349_02253 [Pseudomonas syringae pv. actinidiae]OSN70968.1 hypothetical protein BV351_05047 [Pseudomonas syringae pv. actinidiae]